MQTTKSDLLAHSLKYIHHVHVWSYNFNLYLTTKMHQLHLLNICMAYTA